MRKNFFFLWFLLGLGMHLQIVASLSITELVILVIAPFILFTHYTQMSRDGVGRFFWLAVLVVLGCTVACIVNGTQFVFALRGYAVTTIVALTIPVAYWMLKNDPGGIKWMLLGTAISIVLCTFVFKRSVEVYYSGGSSEEIMEGTIYWVERVGVLALLPSRALYIAVPQVVNITAPLATAIFCATSSTSGRSAALGFIAFATVAFVGGHRQSSMIRISKHFKVMVLASLGFIFAVHFGYRIAATRNWLGEKANEKYEMQTQGRKDILSLLMGGRGQSFWGLAAAVDNPIVGFGPWPEDKKGYNAKFIELFGDQEEVDKYNRTMNLSYIYEKRRMIGCHSHIVEFWVWYGIFGLVFWLYVIFVFLRFYKEDVAVVPQWFGWLACSIPAVFWDIFFSPFSARVATTFIVVGCLMARAVRQGKVVLPYDMVVEINMAEVR